MSNAKKEAATQQVFALTTKKEWEELSEEDLSLIKGGVTTWHSNGILVLELLGLDVNAIVSLLNSPFRLQ